MPLPMDFPTAADELLRLVRERTDPKTPDHLPLKHLATVAGVSYVSLWKWVRGRQSSFGLLDGERVYHTLTGKTFLPTGKPFTR